MVTWTLDTTPPEAELPNAPTGTVGPFPAAILVQGNDVTAYRYRLDDGMWSTMYPVSVPLTLPKLQDGTHTLAVVGSDLVGNWQNSDNATEVVWEVDASHMRFMSFTVIPLRKIVKEAPRVSFK